MDWKAVSIMARREAQELQSEAVEAVMDTPSDDTLEGMLAEHDAAEIGEPNPDMEYVSDWTYAMTVLSQTDHCVCAACGVEVPVEWDNGVCYIGGMVAWVDNDGPCVVIQLPTHHNGTGDDCEYGYEVI